MHRINAQNDPGCTGTEPALLSSAVMLKQNALTVRTRRHISIRNNAKYTDVQSNFVTTGKKTMNELKNLKHRLYIYSSSTMKYKAIIQLKRWYFLAEMSLKKFCSLLINSFILKEFVYFMLL